MTTFTTRTIAAKLLGDEAVDTNAKAATREVRKFLRADAVAAGGQVGIDTPGKGGRYTLDLKVAEVKAMAKRFAAWQVAEAEAKAARAALKESLAKASPAAPSCEVDEASDEELDDDSTDEASGPSDEEIAAMLSDEDDEASDEDDDSE
jgi:hypothetical protein